MEPQNSAQNFRLLSDLTANWCPGLFKKASYESELKIYKLNMVTPK